MYKRLTACSLTAAVLAAVAVAHAAPTPEWKVVFGTTGKVPITPDSRPRLQRDPNSDAVYLYNVGQGILPALAAKLDSTGNPIWSAFERSIFYGFPQNLTVLADGSIVTAHIEATRRAADGTLVWSLATEGYGVAAVDEVAGEILLVAPLTGRVSRLDRATGTTLESLRSEFLGSCYDGELTSHGSEAYWLAGCGGVRALSKIRLAPLGIEWTVGVEGFDGWAHSSASSLAATKDAVFVAWSDSDSSRIARFSAATGQQTWVVDGAYGQTPGVVSDEEANPIAYGASVVEKLDRATGARVWLHPVVGTVEDVAVDAEGIVVAGAADASNVSGFVERLARADGSIAWRQSLTIPATEWINPTSVAVQGDRILVAGVACAANARPERCDVVLWPRDMAGTGAGATFPQFETPASGRAARAPADTTIAAALEYGPDGMQLHVKRVRNDTGAVLWAAVRPVFLPKAPGRLPFHIDLALNDAAEGRVAVLYRPNIQLFMPNTSDTVVATFDTVTGAFLWERSVIDTTGGYTDGLAPYVGIDPAGNVFVASHEAIALHQQPMTQSRRQIRRYSAATGEAMLSIDFAVSAGWAGTDLTAPLFRVVGADILTEQHPLVSGEYATTRISGTSGAAQWSNPSLPFPLPWGYSFVDGASAYVANGHEVLAVSSLDLGSGVASWVTPYADPQDMSYGVETAYRGSDGAIYAGGLRRIPRPGGSPSSWDSRGLLLKLGPDGGIDWVNRFDATPVSSPSGVVLPVFDHGGVLYSWQREARSLESPGYFFTATSTSDGSLRGTQAVYFGDYPFPHLGQGVGGIEVMGTTGDGSPVVQGSFGDSSGLYAFGVAKWPAPQPFAGGALRVALSTSVQSLDRDITTSFVLEATNDGVIDAPDVDVLLAIPAQASTGPVSCMVGSVSCMATISPTSIGHRLDLPVGARVRLAGSVRSPWYNGARLEASAFSPYGFVEMDMKDNIRSVRLDDVLFSHGFD